MDFDKIVLTFSELMFLRKSRKKQIQISKCKRLLRLRLVYELKSCVPGNMPVGTGYCKITNFGKDYLLYRKDLNRTRFLIPIFVSIITTAIINAGIWLLPRLLHWIQ